jgi:hypothetical protein
VTDIWTFARNTRSRDLNWTLIATRSRIDEWLIGCVGLAEA